MLWPHLLRSISNCVLMSITITITVYGFMKVNDTLLAIDIQLINVKPEITRIYRGHDTGINRECLLLRM